MQRRVLSKVLLSFLAVVVTAVASAPRRAMVSGDSPAVIASQPRQSVLCSIEIGGIWK
jgi:hypothetical protein